MEGEKIKLTNILSDKENRIRLVAICIMFFYFLILGKIIIIYTEYETSKAVTPNFVLNSTNSKKFNIVDVNGNLLATSINTYNFYIVPAKTVFAEEIVQKISRLFPEITEGANILEQLKSKQNKMILIKKEITEEQKQAIISSGVESAEFEKSFARVYPYGNIFSHIVGFVNFNLEGVSGIERSLNNELYYQDVETTLDARIQSIMHAKLSDAFEEYKMKSAFGIVASIKNAEIISVVSLPDFNPKKVIDSNGANMQNSAIASSYNLGSVFKILTIAMGVENGVKEDDLFKVDISIPVDKNFILKDEHVKKPFLMPSEILAFSSNVGSVLILEKVGLSTQRKFFEEIGLFAPPKIELSPYEIATPIFKSGIWAKSMHYTATYGYGVALSPLHFVQIARTIIGDGKKRNLTLLKQRKDVEENEVENTIISEKTTKVMQKMLKDVIKNGTAKLANVNGYEICGKTSTSLKFDNKLKRWTNAKKMVSFFAFFPCSKPKYIIYIGFDEPQETKEDRVLQGGRSVAPITASIITEIAPLLNIKPDTFAD